MDTFNVNVEGRLLGSKSDIRKLKDNGFIPGVLYSEGTSTPISLEEDQVRHILNKNGEDVLLNFNFKGKEIKAQIKEVQRNPVSQDILHIDLMPLDNKYLH